MLSIHIIYDIILIAATGEHPFKDKCLFYNFWQDREGALNTPNIQDVAEAEEHLEEALQELVQRGPDAHLRMILRSPLVLPMIIKYHFEFISKFYTRMVLYTYLFFTVYLNI